jgi:MoaA/NifB/PqqE/SkfB family radical SAM enzyme/SAM-dependent methyltransferase
MSASEQLHTEKREGYQLILDAAAPNWAATNADGAWILRRLRSGKSQDEVTWGYARRAAVSLRRALELVQPFADEVSDLASTSPQAPYRGRSLYLEPDRLREVWFHVSDQCNLACRHCLVSSGPGGDPGLDAETLRGTIRQSRDLGADTFYFTGGEPLLRRDLPDLLREVTTTYGATAVVLTNGTLLQGELIETLAALPRERLFLQVSLDGSTAARNDALRSAGSFDGAVRGIRSAVAAGLHVTVATVVLRKNLDDLIPIADVAHGLGVEHMHLMWQHVRERGGHLPRAGMKALVSAAVRLRHHARAIGLVLDNFENVRRTVNGDPGIKYDLSNACWDSLAVYRDGHVFPSACLVGIPSEDAGSLLATPLRQIWLQSEQLARRREQSVVDADGLDGDPWVFLHGGGDPEQAYFASNGNGDVAADPYLPLHRAIARSIIDETVRERRALMGSPPPGPLVYQLMGDDGYGCPTEAGVKNGGEHKVDFVHSNCVLIQDVVAKSRAEIRDYYGEAAREPKTEICQPIAIDQRHLAHIPDEVIARSYGCGSPVFAAAPKPGERVLDLGSGAGMEAFIASRLVGSGGAVLGVDMTPDMLRFATDARRSVAARLGYDNVFFMRGLLEHLPVASDSVDAVISNCVINLSPEKLKVFSEIRRVLKPGGRVVISDIVSQSPLPPEIRFNPRLKGECIAGALTERKLLVTLTKLGFVGIEVLQKNAWRTVDEVNFDTVTVRARKPAAGSPVVYEYPGPFRSVTLDSGQELARGVPAEVDSSLLAAADGDGRIGGTASISLTAPQTHLQDCMVCGSPLVYLAEEAELKCYYCRETKAANAHCEAGHFVCDGCHARDHVGFIRTFCRNTEDVDPIAIFSEMRRSHLFPLHGPEHHALVPAAFLTAYRNQFGEPPMGRVEAAIQRGANLPGGTCAYWGGCAAALGIGVAYAAILRATPLSHEERGTVQTVVSTILSMLGKFDTPRCCRRESYLALRVGCELSRSYLPHALDCGPLPPCDQMALNRECLGAGCPLHPANGDRPRHL